MIEFFDKTYFNQVSNEITQYLFSNIGPDTLPLIEREPIVRGYLSASDLDRACVYYGALCHDFSISSVPRGILTIHTGNAPSGQYAELLGDEVVSNGQPLLVSGFDNSVSTLPDKLISFIRRYFPISDCTIVEGQ